MEDSTDYKPTRYDRLRAKYEAKCQEYTDRVFGEGEFCDSDMRQHRTLIRRIAEQVNTQAEIEGREKLAVFYEKEELGWNSSTRHLLSIPSRHPFDAAGFADFEAD